MKIDNNLSIFIKHLSCNFPMLMLKDKFHKSFRTQTETHKKNQNLMKI